MQALYDWIWNDYLWLSPELSSKDVQLKPGQHRAKASDLYMMLVFAVVIHFVRRIYEIVVARPLAKRLSIIDRRKRPSESKELERAYQNNKTPSNKDIVKLATSVNWNESKVSRWFRRRRNMARPSLVQKFSEANWRCFFYTFAFSFGMNLLVRAPWFWDTMHCWIDFTKQNVWPSVYFYYMLEGGFYISLLFSVMSDVKRKDFNEQIIHHLATIFLITFSYVANFVRIGTLVMAIHDISDIFLEAAKCLHYAKHHVVAESTFTLFAIIFIISRIMVYPYMVMYTTLVKLLWVFEPFPGYYFFNFLLMVLQILHLFWASIIVKMAIKMVRTGNVEKDDRSDEEESTHDEDGEELEIRPKRKEE
ncbi:ceramide synthase 2-like [Clavelina lepadiformis]|uniref:Uncharacterized protein n=1 Tax=Clavelina lepadiformis TaxID=159417 RepID=A0ABP0H0R4_CLALP